MPVALVIIATSIITKMQQKFPYYLPKKLRSWDFLPKPLISLDPYDRVIQKMICCNRHNMSPEDVENQEELQIPS